MNSTSLPAPSPRCLPTCPPRVRAAAALAASLAAFLPGLLMPSGRAQEPPTYYVNVANPTPAFPYTSWATAATNIQEAINAGSEPGRLVLVTNGVYQTGTTQAEGPNRVVLVNAELRSVNGPDVTIIDGSGAVRCAYLGANSTLDGFTLRNGYCEAARGGGLRSAASGVVTNCVLRDNTSPLGGGGALGGTFYTCTLISNVSQAGGGGAAGANLIHCTLTGNSARSGGGAYGGSLQNCTVTGNSASEFGGGASSATHNNCTLTGKSARDGGGARGRNTRARTCQ